MLRTNYADWARIIGVLALVAGCSGTYMVGKSSDNSAAGSAPSAGGSDVAMSGGDGTPGATVTGSDGGSTGSGMAGGSATGSAGASAAIYCGASVAAPEDDSGTFAAPSEVWNRINLFVAGQSQPAPLLPAVTTRQWAGDTATALLDSFAPGSAPGMSRFVGEWLPGTPNSSLWGSLFSEPGATLTDLLTTTQGLNPGSGVLTDPAILQLGISARGAFISQHVLCRTIPPPPPDIPSLQPPTPGTTRREQLEASVNSPLCASCHTLIDPLGDSLEHFSTTGDFSNVDNGQVIDSAGQYSPGDGSTINFTSVSDLAPQLASNCEVGLCLTEQLLADAQSAAQVTPVPNGSASEPELGQIALSFSASGLDLRSLVRAIVESDAFLRPN